MATESINAVKSRIKNIREWVTPARTTSAFLSKGVLTPEEFVKAGDELVFKCPTWSWESGDPSKIRNILPSDKQFLITRNVPCSERVQEMEATFGGETMEIMELATMTLSSDQQQQEGWLISHVTKKTNGVTIEEEFDFITTNEEGENEIITSTQFQATSIGMKEEPEQQLPNPNNNDDDEDEYGDMADLEDDTLLEDEATASTKKEDNIRRVRTYDISITYDKYYQTPKVWIFGYSPSGTPLTSHEMFQDVMQDYVQRTVTVEDHPHLSGAPHLSIHPCQHAAVMKNIVRNLSKGITAPTVEMYLFIFLKFVSSIIPTINYDFTFEVSASTKKD